MPKPKKVQIPIAERRGLQGSMHMPEALCAMLVRADIEQTAGALARELQLSSWTKNAARAELPEHDGREPRFYPFQYRGHSWTTVVHRHVFHDRVARSISSQLRARALFAGYEDTSYCFDYALYDSGRLVDVFHCLDSQEFHLLTPAELAQVEQEGVESCPIYSYYAGSKLRTLDEADFRALCEKRRKQFAEHLDHLFDDFLRSQDAFLAFNTMDEPGRECFPLAEADDVEIVRIDVIE